MKEGEEGEGGRKRESREGDRPIGWGFHRGLPAGAPSPPKTRGDEGRRWESEEGKRRERERERGRGKDSLGKKLIFVF